MWFANLYAKLAEGIIDTFYKPVAKEIVERIEGRRGAWSVLDVGTGSGLLLVEIFKLKPTLLIYGVDLSKKLIKIAQANSRHLRAGLARPNEVFPVFNISFEVGNAYHLRFPDNSFDFVVCSGLFHSLKFRKDAIREWLRVLKGGGDLWIYDPTPIFRSEEIKNPRLLKKRPGLSFADYILLRFLMGCDFFDIPPRTLSHKEAMFLIDNVFKKTFKKEISTILFRFNEDRAYLKIEATKTKRFA